MAVVGAVARTVLPLAEAGTWGLLLEEQLIPELAAAWAGDCDASVEDVAGGWLCQPRRQRSSAWQGSQSLGPGQGGAELGRQHTNTRAHLGTRAMLHSQPPGHVGGSGPKARLQVPSCHAQGCPWVLVSL